MNADSTLPGGHFWFRLFKYSVYALLALNVWLWFLEDYAASAEIFVDGVTWRNLVQAYSATVDTLAWVILLLLFELETAAIPDNKLRGGLKWTLTATRAVCYLFIIYSFYGYLVKYGLVTSAVPFAVDNVCSLIGTGYTYIDSLDNYFPLTPEVCQALQGEALLQLPGTRVIGSAAQLELAHALALTDVINAGDWLIIVALLEIEVLLQHRDLLTDGLLRISKGIKGVLYAILFGCAIYWGIDGEFLDFWDAFLWLVAFIFIEMNIFEWHAETAGSDTGG
ncbi:MAG: hypothetical protein KJO54_00680, partial [Gammaproteobacteria bacterium]|nr:hypothetical protein [Gammaproteobacteria bacterium]